ncbi:MAG: hypothetical protein ABIT20_04115 [Gemmatimonadaceae bacterium]
MKDFDWPLAMVLAVVFVVLSYARWRWFRARMNRPRRTPPPPPDDSTTS